MARKATGQVVERETKAGRMYALRFRAYGRREYVTLGSAAEGWTPRRAEVELENVLADVRRGIWRAPTHVETVSTTDSEPTFHEFASEWFAQKCQELRPTTVEAYEWRLSYVLLPFFASHRLTEITVQEVDRYRLAKVRERDLLRAARERGEKIDRRPLANDTINRTISLLAQILEVAVEYGHIPTNPATGRRRRLKSTRPARSYLDSAGQISALLDAAGELDRGARVDRRHVPRRATIATLTFAGLRIGELLDLRWRDVDLASGWLRVRESKTDAGRRDVKIRPALRDELLAHKAGAEDYAPDALVFGTSTGRRQSPGNVRSRVLVKSVERANVALEEARESSLPERLTPHSLRRTFASILYAIGEPAPVVMAEMGHTDPELALSIYAHAMRRDEDENRRVKALVNGEEWPSLGTGAQSTDDAAGVQSRTGEPETPQERGKR